MKLFIGRVTSSRRASRWCILYLLAILSLTIPATGVGAVSVLSTATNRAASRASLLQGEATPTVTLSPTHTSTPVPSATPAATPSPSGIPPDATWPGFSSLGLSFVPNAGQTDPTVRFQVSGMGGTMFFTPGEIVLAVPVLSPTLALPSDEPELNLPPGQFGDIRATPVFSYSVARIRFQGANPTPEIEASDALPGGVNYFIGNDPAKWRTNLPTYAGIVYREIYPGIDLKYEGTEGLLKSTYTVAPGADPGLIRWRYDGATDLRVDAASTRGPK